LQRTDEIRDTLACDSQVIQNDRAFQEIKGHRHGRAAVFLGRLTPVMRSFISSIFVSFKPTTAAEHLDSLQRYLKLAGLRYTERL